MSLGYEERAPCQKSWPEEGMGKAFVMKSKLEEKWSDIAGRRLEWSKTWAGLASVVSLVWTFLVAGTGNAMFDNGWHRLPGPRWLLVLFIVTSLLALFWYLTARALRQAYDARVHELKEAAVDYAALLKEFMPTHDEVNVRLARLAYAAKDACDAEREQYELGNHFMQQESDPEESLVKARMHFEQCARVANAVVKERLAAFWNLHRLIQWWLPYQLLDSWKKYLSIAPQQAAKPPSPASGTELYPRGMSGGSID